MENRCKRCKHGMIEGTCALCLKEDEDFLISNTVNGLFERYEQITKSKEASERKLKQKQKNSGILMLDLTGKNDLMERLLKEAEKDFRTPEFQALYYINSALNAVKN